MEETKYFKKSMEVFLSIINSKLINMNVDFIIPEAERLPEYDITLGIDAGALPKI